MTNLIVVQPFLRFARVPSPPPASSSASPPLPDGWARVAAWAEAALSAGAAEEASPGRRPFFSVHVALFLALLAAATGLLFLVARPTTSRDDDRREKREAESVPEQAGAVDKNESAAKPDVLAEAERHIISSRFIYLYPQLRVLAGAGYTPFGLDDISGSLRIDGIFASLLRTLRAERPDEPGGLRAALGGAADAWDLRALDAAIAAGLADRGDPVEMGAPYETHQHVGSRGRCLCAKFGMHHTQVMLDHLVRSEDEKRQREAAASRRLLEHYDVMDDTPLAAQVRARACLGPGPTRRLRPVDCSDIFPNRQ